VTRITRDIARHRRAMLRAVFIASLALVVALASYVVGRERDSSRVEAAGTLRVPYRTAPPSTARAPYPIAPPATAAPVAAAPVSLTIAKIGVAATIDPVGVKPGTNELAVPPIERAGWYEVGVVPGQPGSAVILGHVDGGGRRGVFFDLGRLAPGDIATITYRNGTRRAFRVIGRDQIAKTKLPAEFFARTGPARVVFITCGGSFNAATHHYRDNVVVVAVPV
jgi:hypothetical protein